MHIEVWNLNCDHQQTTKPLILVHHPQHIKFQWEKRKAYKNFLHMIQHIELLIACLVVSKVIEVVLFSCIWYMSLDEKKLSNYIFFVSLREIISLQNKSCVLCREIGRKCISVLFSRHPNTCRRIIFFSLSFLYRFLCIIFPQCFLDNQIGF